MLVLAPVTASSHAAGSRGPISALCRFEILNYQAHQCCTLAVANLFLVTDKVVQVAPLGTTVI